MNFDRAVQAKAKAFGVQDNDLSAVRVEDYITHVHNVMSDEITSRFEQPYMTDEEVGEVLFNQTLQQELERVKPKDTDFEIRL